MEMHTDNLNDELTVSERTFSLNLEYWFIYDLYINRNLLMKI